MVLSILTPLSGTPPFTYIWSNSNTTYVNANLCDSIYIYTVLDNNGCGSTDTIVLTTRIGCTDTSAYNYDPNALYDDGSCIPFVYGCTDSTAINYDPLANSNDGNCMYCSIGITQLIIGSNSAGICDGWVFVNSSSSYP